MNNYAFIDSQNLNLLLTILPLIGVIIGALITSGFQYFIEKRKQQAGLKEKFVDIKIEAYKSLWKCLGSLDSAFDKKTGAILLTHKSQSLTIKKFAQFDSVYCQYYFFYDEETQKTLKDFLISGQKILPAF